MLLLAKWIEFYRVFVVNNLKGSCFFANEESQFAEHIMIVLSEPCGGCRLAVPISSIKYKEDGHPRYYDQSCVFDVDDIKSPDGRNVLSKKSFASYKHAKEIVDSQVMIDQIRKIYSYRCNVTPQILERIQAGAKKSDDLEERFEKYFNFF